MDELLKKTTEELVKIKAEKREELQKLVQNVIKEKEKNVSKIPKLRKEIARVATALTQKGKEAKNG